MTYDETTSSNPTREPIIHFFALAGSLPELAAKINMIHETMSAIVITVQMK